MLQYGQFNFALKDTQVSWKSEIPLNAFYTGTTGRQQQSSSPRFKKVIKTESLKQIVLPQSQSPQKQSFLTRSTRNSSLKEPSLSNYLTYMEQIKQQNQRFNKELQHHFKEIEHHVQEMREQFREQEKKKVDALRSAKNIVTRLKFQKVRQTTDQQLSLRVKEEMEKQKELQQIQQKEAEDLQKTIDKFSERLERLRRLWQNDNRLTKFILQHSKHELVQVIHQEQFHVSMNLQQISIIFNKTQNKHYGQYLTEISEQINKILRNNQIQELKDIKKSIRTSLSSISSQEDVQKKHCIKKNPLSYYSLMMHNENKDLMLEKAERVHGPMNLVSPQTRQMNQALKDTLQTLTHY
ncbi:hypothetical protein pb186bvf_007494 [Paramecium bursaria]